MRRLDYVVRLALANLAARPWATAASVTTIAAAFALLAGYLVLFGAVERAAAAWGGRLEVAAYLDDAVGEAGGRALAERVASWAGAAAVTYVSKAEALARFRAALGGETALLDALPDNPLPASLEVRLAADHRTPEGIRRMAAALAALPGVTDVEYGREEAERLAALVRAARAVGLALALALALVALLIVAATVRLALESRRDEVEILRLVGASEAFVRAPFLVEGAVQGLAGALLAVGAAAAAHRFALPRLLGEEAWLAPLVPFLPPATVAALAAGGLAVGLAGSWLSAARRQVER